MCVLAVSAGDLTSFRLAGLAVSAGEMKQNARLLQDRGPEKKSLGKPGGLYMLMAVSVGRRRHCKHMAVSAGTVSAGRLLQPGEVGGMD